MCRIETRLVAVILLLCLATAPLVSQTLSYSTLLGGSKDDHARDMTVDAAGFVYVAGETRSTNFPSAGGAVGIFVAKFDPIGNGPGDLHWVTLPGGSGQDFITWQGVASRRRTGVARCANGLLWCRISTPVGLGSRD